MSLGTFKCSYPRKVKKDAGSSPSKFFLFLSTIKRSKKNNKTKEKESKAS
jgi:hypothetical protein